MAEKLRTYNDLLKLIQDSEREYDLALIDKAYQLAYQMHGDQKRLSGAPYISHPIAVACILVEMGMDSESVAAGLLHDVVEDTVMTVEQVGEQFGTDVAFLVEGVTKLQHMHLGDNSGNKTEAQHQCRRRFIFSFFLFCLSHILHLLSVIITL